MRKRRDREGEGEKEEGKGKGKREGDMTVQGIVCFLVDGLWCFFYESSCKGYAPSIANVYYTLDTAVATTISTYVMN